MRRSQSAESTLVRSLLQKKPYPELQIQHRLCPSRLSSCSQDAQQTLSYLQNLVGFQQKRGDRLACTRRTSVLPLLHLQYYKPQMADLGLAIRIPKESLIKLGELQGKELVIKFNGGREVAGKLKSWDKAMNLILQGTQEMLGLDEGVETSRVLGLVIVKGSQIQSICLKNGYEVIDNPYADAVEE